MAKIERLDGGCDHRELVALLELIGRMVNEGLPAGFGFGLLVIDLAEDPAGGRVHVVSDIDPAVLLPVMRAFADRLATRPPATRPYKGAGVN